MTAQVALERFHARDVADPPPDLESFAALLYDALAPLATLDGQADWHLAHYCGALGAMFQPVADAGTDGFRRGTAEAIRVAAQATLTGGRTVYFRERDPSAADPPYTLQVVTVETETPDPATTLAAILAQKPGGIVLDFHTVTGWDYTAMTAVGGTYDALALKFATYDDLRDNEPTG
jgi:hypothetical protein